MKGILNFKGVERTLISFRLPHRRRIDTNGYPCSLPRDSFFYVSFLAEEGDDFFLHWMCGKNIAHGGAKGFWHDGEIVFYDETSDGQEFYRYDLQYVMPIHFCLEYDHQNGMVIHLTLTALDRVYNHLLHTENFYGYFFEYAKPKEKRKPIQSEDERKLAVKRIECLTQLDCVGGKEGIVSGKSYIFKISEYQDDITPTEEEKKNIKWDFSYTTQEGVVVGTEPKKVGDVFILDTKNSISLEDTSSITINAYFIDRATEGGLEIEILNSLEGVFVWTETKGTGHVFVSIHRNDEILVYTYGRYDDVDFIQITGEGVLIKLQDTHGEDYIKDFLYKKEGKSYKIGDVTESKVSAIFDDLWNSSNEKPNSSNAGQNTKEYGRVIDKYDVSGNNCTTVTCDVLKKAGSNVFNFNALLFGEKIYSYEENFTIPYSLQNFLEEQKQTNENIKDVTDIMKKVFPNDEKISKMGKTGIFGETSGSFGNSSGASANSSNTETLSSGSGSGSSGGAYGSSSN